MILEREPELAALRRAAQAARRGDGSLVLIEGPAGVGKSALLAAVPAGGTRLVRASGSEWERDFAFGAIRQLLAQAPDTAFSGAAAAAAVVRASPPAEALEPGFGLLDAIHWAVAGLAPITIVLDDLHWVDDASLQALAYLARRAHDLPVLIVGALRLAEPGAPVEMLDGLRALATVLTPAPLSPAAVATLVRAERPEADDQDCAAFHVASAGNPLYVRELLQAGLDADAGIPALGERVVRRVARLAPEAPALAGAIAVLGDGQPLALATALAELEPDTAERLAHELVRVEILAGDAPPAFSHPVIRHSLYEALSGARRASMHAAAAEALDAAGAPIDAVAAHLAALPPAGSHAVAARLHDAGVDALGRGAVATALARLRRALEEGAGPRAAILFELGRAESFARDPAAFGHLEEALALGDAPLRLRARVVLSELYAYAGMWPESAATIDAGSREPDPELQLTAVGAVLDANDPGRVDGFTAAWDDLTRASRQDLVASPAIAALLASEAVSRGRTAEVAGHVRAAWRNGVVPGTGDEATWPAPQLLMALIHSDALEQAEALGRALTESGRRTGASTILLLGLMAPAWTAARRGDLGEAEARMETVLEIVQEAGLAMWITSAAWMVEDVLAERNALSPFTRLVIDMELPPEFDGTSSGASLRAARARIALAGADRATALAQMQGAAPVFRALGVGPARIPWRSRLALAADDPALAAEELSLAKASGYPRPIGIALRTLGVLLEDVGLLRESALALKNAPSALERAYTCVELGVQLRRRGELAEARRTLSEAADLAHHCGAERLLDRVREELQAAGARPRRAASTGWEALTPRELHVARLAATGHTNVAIAQELFVSVKTVETHLTNAYGKLGLAGRGARDALAAAVRPRGTS